MHPDDVAERVAEEVEILRARLAAAPDLRVHEVRLFDRFELRVPFTKVGYSEIWMIPIPTRTTCRECGVRFAHVVPVKRGRFERELILRCYCDDYDGQAVTAELLRPDGSELPEHEWPKTLGQQVIIRGHEDYDRPFFCRRGLREYHSHPQHQDNPWDAHREAVRIYDIVPELLHDLQTRWDVG